MWLRSLGVIAFIAIVGATGIYFARRPTIANGDVVAADLLKTSPQVRSLDCDKQIPIGRAGATFTCMVELENGQRGRLKIVMDRSGSITAVDEPEIRKSSDPWAD
jgi:hypothetical protein